MAAGNQQKHLSLIFFFKCVGASLEGLIRKIITFILIQGIFR